MKYYVLDHEVNMSDLKKFNLPNQKLGVIIHIENDEGKILLQKRGKKSRDENGLYEEIGGKFDSTDKDFKSAIKRELKEEAGTEVKINISDSIGIFICPKNNINWIFIIYFGKYISGEFKIMEPDKCEGYKFFEYNEAINSNLVSESCKFLIKSIKK